MSRSMLTTIDNPYSPFDQFSEWYAWDVSSGYHTSSFLARIITDSHELSEADQEVMLEAAIDECVRENVLGVFTKVTKEE